MKTEYIVMTSLFVAALSGCGIGGMAGPFPGGYEVVDSTASNKPKVKPAAPQTVYRIDENRFFEVVPVTQYQCSGTLYYTDKAQAIHKSVAGWSEISRGPFSIDAANTDYLVGPILPASGNCAADTANRPSCSSRLPYSTDGGRSWKYMRAETNADLALIGAKIFGYRYSAYYKTYDGKSLDLQKIINTKEPEFSFEWTEFESKTSNFAKPRKAPIDTKFHCNRNAED